MLLLFPLVVAGELPTDVRLQRVCNHLVAELAEPLRPETVVVVLETEPDCDLESLMGECTDLGVDVQVEARGLVQVETTWDQLDELANLPGVTRVREPLLASPKDEVTEGKDVIFTVDWHEQGITGTGVKVAVLDVGFSGWEDLVGTELPEGIVDHGRGGEEDDAVTGTSSHGTAVSEVIHDIAPGAELHLWQFRTEVEFFAALEEVLEEDIDVVNASIGFDNVWHADGASPFALAVDQVVDEGVVYVAAAGNETGKYRIGELTDVDGDGWAEIGGMDSVQVTNAFAGSKVSLRWSEPFGEASTDLDLVLFDDDGDECDISEEVQDGDDNPTESAECVVNGPWVHAWIRVDSGSIEGLTAYVYAPYGVTFAAEASTLTLPADAEGAISIGAYDGRSGELLEYSSRGPTDDGRIKPDFVAPSGVSTTSYSVPFDGTSAAAPHVTGVAALILDRKRRNAGTEDVYAVLLEQVEDLGEAGQDNDFGHGAVHTAELPGRCGCASFGLGGGWFLAMVVLLRRRC
jgi:subtilisin family serine protease